MAIPAQSEREAEDEFGFHSLPIISHRLLNPSTAMAQVRRPTGGAASDWLLCGFGLFLSMLNQNNLASERQGFNKLLNQPRTPDAVFVSDSAMSRPDCTARCWQ
jgi:hypothetical protein